MRQITIDPEKLEDPNYCFVASYSTLDSSNLKYIGIEVRKTVSPFYLDDLPLFEHAEKTSNTLGSILIEHVEGEHWNVLHSSMDLNRVNVIKESEWSAPFTVILSEIASQFVDPDENNLKRTAFELQLFECTPEEFVERNFVDCL